MGYCKDIKFDCNYINDQDDDCNLDYCKYNIEIKFDKNGDFTTKPIKKRKKKNAEK